MTDMLNRRDAIVALAAGSMFAVTRAAKGVDLDADLLALAPR